MTMHAEVEQVLRGERQWCIVEGDALSLLPTLPDGCVDAVVTDPPFKLSQEYSANADPDNLVAVSLVWPVAVELLRVVKPGGLLAMFYDTRILPLALQAMGHAGWKYLRALTFYRRWGQASLVHGWMSTSDFILLFARPGGKPAYHGKPSHDVYTKAEPEAGGGSHPAQKPLACVTHLVERICPPGGTVLDPFAGSGSTLVAAVLVGRNAVGIEKEAAHVATARRRLDEASNNVGLFAGLPQQPPTLFPGEG